MTINNFKKNIMEEENKSNKSSNSNNESKESELDSINSLIESNKILKDKYMKLIKKLE